MIKHKSGAQKQEERVIRARLRCKGQQIRLESFGIVGRKSEKDLVKMLLTRKLLMKC